MPSKLLTRLPFGPGVTTPIRLTSNAPCSARRRRGRPSVGSETNVTGPVSGVVSSGVVALPEPITEFAGQVPASYWATGQALASEVTEAPRPISSATATLLALASPGRCVTVTTTSGWAPGRRSARLVPSLAEICGANGSLSQAVGVNEGVAVAAALA